MFLEKIKLLETVKDTIREFHEMEESGDISTAPQMLAKFLNCLRIWGASDEELHALTVPERYTPDLNADKIEALKVKGRTLPTTKDFDQASWPTFNSK